MAITQDVVVLNDISTPDRGGSVERRERTTSTGTHVRYSMSIKAEPVLHEFSGLRLGAGVAKAIAEVLRERMRTGGKPASPATQHKRVVAQTSLAIGHPSTVARYSGGRTGTTPPNVDGGGRLYFDSGRFANGIAAMENKEEDGWTINVPANRLDPRTFGGGEAAISAFWTRLTTDIPEFLGGQALLAHARVRAAIEQAAPEAIYVAKRTASGRLAKARWDLVQRVLTDVGRLLR